jgi:hypothetical protein
MNGNTAAVKQKEEIKAHNQPRDLGAERCV